MISDEQTQPPALSMENMREAVLAAAKAYRVSSFVIVGRASLAVTMPHADPLLRTTMDVDLFPPWDESKAAAWAAADLSIGRLSDFRRKHGFYVERVAEWTTLQLPPGWEDRATILETGGIHAKAIHPLDLVCAKLSAGRGKDFAFVKSALELGLFTVSAFLDFIRTYMTDSEAQGLLAHRIDEAQKHQEDEE